MKKLSKLLLVGVAALAGATAMTSCSSNGKIIIGVTDYEPMDYLDKDGETWIGFDADLARKVFEDLGYNNVEFQEIEWDNKNIDLTSKTIDCIWNGMTITDELKDAFAITDPYLQNFQYGVIRKTDSSKYTNMASLNSSDVKVTCEAGSAADDALQDLKEDDNYAFTLNPSTSQMMAANEVSMNTSDVAVIDYSLAQTCVASNDKLMAVDLGFEKEEFGIAFRKDDQVLCNNVNQKIKDYYKDGTIAELAEKYGVTGQLVK